MHGRRSPLGRTHAPAAPELFTLNEITVMFGVNATTVTRWVRSGRITTIRLPGGTTRFRADEIAALLQRDRGDQSLP